MHISRVDSSPVPAPPSKVALRDSDGDNDGDKGPKKAVDNDAKTQTLPPPDAATGAGKKMNAYA